MSDWDGFDDRNNENEEVVEGSLPVEENPIVEVVEENMPVEESAPTDAVVPYNSSQYGNSSYGRQIPPGGSQGSPYNYDPYNNPYNNQYNNNQYNNQYNNNPYNNNQYSNNQYNNPYNNSYNNPYSNNQYNNNQYNNTQYGNNPYNSNQYGNNPYGGQIPPGGSQGSQYNNNPYNSQYNSQYNNNPYNNQYSSQYNNNQYNNNQYNNNPYNNDNSYSPYAMPPKKNKNGLIIGIVIGIVVLFLIVVFALIYRVTRIITEDSVRTRNNRDVYQFDYDDDDWGADRYWRDSNPDYDDYDSDDWYDYDWFGYGNDDSQYYDFHDAIRVDLSYSVDMDYYRYDADNENVDIWAEYPIIEGGNVPNLDKLNDAIRSEVDSFISYFEEEFENYITEDDYYEASIRGYVTYMDEDKISIAFDERVYSDDYSGYIDLYLYCINIDMENGVVLENQNILRIDDDFSVDFRERSDIQNGENYYISMMSDQEITDYFNSPDIIVFYTPMGMEIGFNYAEGWITVTYSEYEQYLKVF